MKSGSAVLLLAGCVTAYPRVGKPTETLPPGLAWCSVAVRQAHASPGKAPENCEDTFCQRSAELVSPCNPTLYTEVPLRKFTGELVFGVSTDATGHVTDICFIRGNLGAVSKTLSCLAAAARQSAFTAAPNGNAEMWRVTYFID